MRLCLGCLLLALLTGTVLTITLGSGLPEGSLIEVLGGTIKGAAASDARLVDPVSVVVTTDDGCAACDTDNDRYRGFGWWATYHCYVLCAGQRHGGQRAPLLLLRLALLIPSTTESMVPHCTRTPRLPALAMTR